ncbi:hypothetical protein, partial [Luteibacter sp.]|uniref:hypothetical protein n=1 Tax=Luteibacter sp. TaxID=1886636 RepID=UPI003F815238
QADDERDGKAKHDEAGDEGERAGSLVHGWPNFPRPGGELAAMSLHLARVCSLYCTWLVLTLH